jgi:hypothetical protein
MYSLWQTKRWICWFKDDDLDVKTKIGQEYAFWTSRIEFERHREKFLFRSGKVLAKHFSTSVSTISGMLKTRLEL